MAAGGRSVSVSRIPFSSSRPPMEKKPRPKRLLFEPASMVARTAKGRQVLGGERYCLAAPELRRQSLGNPLTGTRRNV